MSKHPSRSKPGQNVNNNGLEPSPNVRYGQSYHDLPACLTLYFISEAIMCSILL